MKLHQFKSAENGADIYINPEHVALVSEIDKVKTEIDPEMSTIKTVTKLKVTRMVLTLTDRDGGPIEVDVLDGIDSVVSRLRM